MRIKAPLYDSPVPVVRCPPIRVLMSASPVVFVMLPLLWLTGYPPEEWPFVSCVFTLSLIGSGTLTGYTALLATKWLHGYARAVATKLGIELEQPENRTPRSSRECVVILGVISLLAMASWGFGSIPIGVRDGTDGNAAHRNPFLTDRAHHARSRWHGFYVHHRWVGGVLLRRGLPPGKRTPLLGTISQLDDYRRRYGAALAGSRHADSNRKVELIFNWFS